MKQGAAEQLRVSEWPVLTRYDRDHLRKIALPLGGIGAGTVSLGGRGNLTDWEVVNRPAKGFAPRNTFFALYAEAEGEPAVTRLLEGEIDDLDADGPYGCRVPNPGLPRFRDCSFAAAYPFGQVLLRDADVPLEVRIGGFNPLVPGDADASGIPVAVLKFELTNRGDRTVRASVCGCMENFIGCDGLHGAPKRNVNEYREAASLVGIKGLFLRSRGVSPASEQFGTMALATTEASVTHSPDWKGWDIKHSWSEKLINFWDDFSADGRLEPNEGKGGDAPIASLAASVVIPPGEARTVTFLIAWHFPNRRSWDVLIKPKVEQDNTKCCGGGVCTCEPTERIGNYYAQLYADAWDVARQTAERLDELERKTLLFVRSLIGSDLPDEAKEAALYNLSTLRSQTCFRAEDGRLFGWEGCGDRHGSCHGNATHVWNYELATGFLFGELAQGMRDSEFRFGVTERGLLNHRLMLPLHRAKEFGVAAADGQTGTIMRLYREWKLSGDDAFLRRLWPHARRAIEFCWQEGGWDADRDGVMEGCQHVTYDVEFYGPNPLSGIWYLGALRAAEEMAAHLGEAALAAECRRLFEQGSAWIDRHLFNGEYYEQQVRSFDPKRIAPGLQTGEGAITADAPELQLGEGCLADQLVGQLMARLFGLGDLLDPDHVRCALRSVLAYNRLLGTRGFFNPMRSFVLNGEEALVVCAYPKGDRPKFPFPYFSEVMNGMEYAAAVHMLCEGMEEEGLRVIRNVRARYDGRKRNPFNEQECGNHYVRSMAAWGAVLALTGFQYSGVDGSLAIRAASGPAVYFWSNGYAWGTVRQEPEGDSRRVELSVLHGELRLRRFTLSGWGSVNFSETASHSADTVLRFRVPRQPE